jgi:hypothetical protein
MKRLGVVVALWAAGQAGRSRADTNADVAPPGPASVPTARPVIPIEDTRSHGPTARNWYDVAATPALLLGREGTIFQLTSQLGLGFPPAGPRELRDIYKAYHLNDYQLRIRNDLFDGSDSATGGPMTIALQRYFPLAPLAISPLAYAHVGIEAALSTPWLSGRSVTPHRTIQILDGVDTELASDGWSIRPVSTYLRADFLACRSESVDLGIEPEAFVPATGPNEYGARFHVAGGWSFGCHGNMSPYAPKIALEYRGRVTMYAGDRSPSYHQSTGVAVQIDYKGFVGQLFYRSDPGELLHYGTIGVRLQIGSERGAR